MYIYFHRRWTSIFLMHGNRRVTALTWCIAWKNLQMPQFHMITSLHLISPRTKFQLPCRTMPAPCFPQETLWDPYDPPASWSVGGWKEGKREVAAKLAEMKRHETWHLAHSYQKPFQLAAFIIYSFRSLRELQAAVPLLFLISITPNRTISLQGKK